MTIDIQEYYHVEPPDGADEPTLRAYAALNQHLLDISRRLENFTGKATQAQVVAGTSNQLFMSPYNLQGMMLDEDDMASDSATKWASQQSIAAYVAANKFFSNVQFPDSEASDQGAADGTYNSVKDIVDSHSEYVTLVFRHTGASDNTTYTFSTAETTPYYYTVIVEPGALIYLNGVNVTFNGPFIAPRNYVFNWSGSVTPIFGNFTDEIFVEWFNALGDGSTDDKAAIQEAINTVEASTCKVMSFGPGTFHMGDAATHDSGNITIKGQGRQISVLEGSWSAGSQDYLLILGAVDGANQNQRIRVENLGFDGHKANLVGGLWVQNCHDSYIRHCWFDECSKGINLGNGSRRCNRLRIQNCLFGDNTRGVQVTSHIGCFIEDCLFGGTGDAHIWSDPGTSDYYDSLTIQNVEGFTAATYGIYINIDNALLPGGGSSTGGHIGHWNNIVIEGTTTAGIYVDGGGTGVHADLHGRFMLAEYYGDKIDIRNCDNFTALGGQFHGANNYSSVPNPFFGGTKAAGAGVGTTPTNFGSWGTEHSANGVAASTNYDGSMSQDGMICAYIAPSDPGRADISLQTTSGNARVIDTANIDNANNIGVGYAGACIPVRLGDGYRIAVTLHAGTFDIDVFQLYYNAARGA